MQNRDEYHNRLNLVHSPITGDTWAGPFNVIHNHVASSPIIHGNMHDPNNWSYVTWIRKNWTGRRYSDYGGGWLNPDITGVFDCLDFALPPWEQSNLYNQALDRLYDQLRGGLDLSVDFAQTRQVRRMFRGLREAEALARTVGSGARRAVANGWLEFQYGWKPLFDDLFGAANELTNHVLNTLKKFRATSSHYMQDSETITNGGFTLTRHTSGKQACTIVCVFELPGFSLDRFTSLNPISLGWEIIPYSFVIDWVLDIGSFLRSLETSLLYGSRFKSGYISELYTVRQNLTLDGQHQNSGYVTHIDDNDAWWRQTSFSRSVLSGAPAPRIPSIHAQMGWQRWLSAGALLQQVLK